MNNENEEFDLFATDLEDNLKETLAKGNYRWTNKYTAILGALAIVTASLSGGIWYGNSHAASANLLLASARIKGAAAAGAFSGAVGATTGTAAGSGFGSTGTGGAGGAGGFSGASRVSGTVTTVSGSTITITLKAPPSTPIAVGDAVTVRDTTSAGAAGTGATGGAAGSATSGATPGAKTKKGKRSASGGGTTTAGGTGGTNGAASPQPSGAPGAVAPGAPGGAAPGGGRFSNPAFIDCLAKAGVSFASGTRPDRTDPKVSAAIASCAASLGLGGGGAGGTGGARPAPTSTP